MARVCRAKAQAKAKAEGKAAPKPKAKAMQIRAVSEASVAETLQATVYELPDEQWIMAVGTEIAEESINMVHSEAYLMADSGAVTSVTRPSTCAWSPIVMFGQRQLHGVSGERLQQHGKREVRGHTSTGRSVSINTTVAEVSKDILSVPDVVDEGFSVVFTPNGAYI
eukprot:6473418-Amphidinium_carterae.1